jgi:hypothetical protein
MSGNMAHHMAYNDWPERFPETTWLVPYRELRHSSDPEIKELYDRAKNHEDREAAAELVNRLINDEGIAKIKRITSEYPRAIIVSIHALEGKGKNRIPQALAEFIGAQGCLEVDNTIVQANIVSKTGSKSPWYRMVHRSRFEGLVKAGRDYILVDDVVSAGGTLNEFRHFVETNGGKVVSTIAMANGAKSLDTNLAVTPGHILELERKYGVELLRQFLHEENLYGGNYKALTDSEARTLLGAPSLDEARDRIIEARQERNFPVFSEMVPGASPDTNTTRAEAEKVEPAPGYPPRPQFDPSQESPLDGEKQTSHISFDNTGSYEWDKNIPKETIMSDAYEEMTDHELEILKKVKETPAVNVESGLEAGVVPQEQAGKVQSPADKAFWTVLHQRKVVTEALKEGTLACLPGADGYADTGPAVNLANGTRYHGANLLQLKEFQKQNKFPTAEFVTQDAVRKSGIPIRKGEHGIDISFSSKNTETGEWDHTTVKLFNVAQSVAPSGLKKWAAEHMEEHRQEREAYNRSQYGGNYQPPERTAKKDPGPEITCSSTEPEKYLGQYLAAVSMGGTFKATSKQAEEFGRKFEGALYEKMENGYSDPFKLTKLCNAASRECKECIKDLRKEQKLELQQGQTQSRGL